jgi:hypothetical protein
LLLAKKACRAPDSLFLYAGYIKKADDFMCFFVERLSYWCVAVTLFKCQTMSQQTLPAPCKISQKQQE